MGASKKAISKKLVVVNNKLLKNDWSIVELE